MLLSGRAPVRWPDPDELVRTWTQEVGTALEQLDLRPDGRLEVPAEVPADGSIPTVTTEEVPFRLVGGTHLAPGATYRAEEEGLDLDVVLQIGGVAQARTVSVRYRPPRRLLRLRSDAGVELELDGLDHPRTLRTTSTLPYLAWRADGSTDPEHVFSGELQLRWLLVRLDAQVQPDGDGGTDLVVQVEVHGRGLWAPVVGTALGLSKPFTRRGLSTWTETVAGRLTTLAEGGGWPRTRSRAEEDQLLRHGVEHLRHRLHRVVDAVDQRPRLRRGARAWRQAYDALPAATPPPWPTGLGFLLGGSWPELEQQWSDLLAGTRHDRRRPVLDDTADAKLEQARARTASLSTRPDIQDDFALSDRDLDLRWLRSPWSIYRYVRRRSRNPGASVPARDDVLV